MNVLELSFPDLIEEVVLLPGPERVIALQHNEQKHPQAPKICVVGYVIFFGDDFRGHVGGCSTEGIDSGRGNRLQAEPEINQFELLIAVEQDVFSLDIAVDDIPLVEIADGFGDSLEELLGLGLLHAVLWLGKQVVVEGISPSVLLDQVDLRATLDDFDELGNHRVV